MELGIKAEKGIMDVAEEKCSMTDCDDIIIHMDMKVYREEESNNCDEEVCSLTMTQDHCLGMQCDPKDVFSNILKDHSKENFTNTLLIEVKNENHEDEEEMEVRNENLEDKGINKFNINLQTFIPSIKTVVNNRDSECDNNENDYFQNNVLKQYGLRKRKNVLVKDAYSYISSDTDLITKKKIQPSHTSLLECSKCSYKFTSSNNCVDNSMCSFCNSVKYEKYSNDKIAFKCEKCNRIFNNENELELHIMEKQCRDMKGYTCDICKRTFMDFNVLKRHIAAHLENHLQCLNCGESFESETLLTQHDCSTIHQSCWINEGSQKEQYDKLFKHHNENYKCLECNKLFSSSNYLQEHSRNCAQTVQNYPDCPKKFRDFVEHQKHAKLHKANIRNCKNFKKNVTNDMKLGEHLSECPALNQKVEYECDFCHKKFLKLSKLQIHILNIHHGVSYKCDKCNMKFLNEEERDSHVAKNCQTEEPCRCEVCGKLFAKKDYLKKHEYTHSNVLYRCKFCHCAFKKEKSYKKHIEGMNCSKSARKIRLNEFNYKKCRICQEEFDEETSLLEHFAENHPSQNAHQCFCCDSCLPTFSDLQNHIHLHNIQKYTCNLCGKPYTSQEGFRKHRLKHKGAEFKCQFCESEFLNERRFKFHVKTCKKNPESAYHSSEEKSSKKDGRQKQSRQLHWESRIIMKRLRGDPNSVNSKCPDQSRSQDSVASINFFDEPDAESNVRGWFDDYYKTEEDDFAFGLIKESTCKNSEPSAGAVEYQKEKHQLPTVRMEAVTSGAENDNEEDSHESSSSETSDSSSEEEFIEEVELPHNYNPKKCRFCMITFSQEYELLHHFIKLHPDKKAHKCPNCEVEYPLFAQLKEHMKNHGIGMGIYNCDNCSKKFRSEKKMKSHNIRCKGVDIDAALSDGTNKTAQLRVDYEDYCKRCGKKFQTKCGYRRHKQLCKEKRKANKENKKVEGYEEPAPVGLMDAGVECPSPAEKSGEESAAPSKQQPAVMDANSTDASEPQDGKSSRDGYAGEPPLDSFPCRLCDKKFQYERGIVMHFKSDHPGNKPLVCHICNMHLADKLKEHLKTHGIGEEFICELCGKRFNQKFLSKIHEMWHQGIEYKCNNCKQKFLNKEKMDKHISESRCSNRQSLMRLPCDKCGKSYRSKFGLTKHYITHTPKELRPVKNRMNCEFCGKWFETNNGLQRHRRIHTGERPFCCRFCSKAFVQEGNCKSHERIHTGEPRPRKKKIPAPSDPAASADLTSCIFNTLNPGMQTELH